MKELLAHAANIAELQKKEKEHHSKKEKSLQGENGPKIDELPDKNKAQKEKPKDILKKAKRNKSKAVMVSPYLS